MGEEQIYVLEDFQQMVHGLAITNDRADRDRAFYTGGDGTTELHCIIAHPKIIQYYTAPQCTHAFVREAFAQLQRLHRPIGQC